MSELKHTPEPWEFLEDHTGIVVFKMRSLAGGRPTNDTIAHFPKRAIAFTSRISDDEVSANARLFLAAPRMLKVLISLVGTGQRGDFSPGPHVTPINSEGGFAISLAKQILDELEGGGQ